MGGGQSSTSQTSGSQSNVNMIPQWVQNAGQQNYALAQGIAEQPLQQYQGQTVAGVAPQTQQAWNLAASSGNVGSDQFNAATAGNLNALGQTPMSINPAQLANTNLSPYMNPYTQNVINATLPIMQQNLALSQNQQQNQANAANAYGGSRQGIQQGVTQAQGAMGMAQMAQQLNQANFQQAQQAAQSDVAAQNLAQYQNQTAQQAKINSDIQASAGLGAIGTDLGRQNAANYAMLSSAGAGQQQQQQNQINANLAKFQQAWNYPTQGLGIMESSLNMTPYNTASAGTSGSTTQTQTTDSPNFASLALGGLQTLGGLFTGGAAPVSDRKVKKNIVPLGRDPVTRVPVKAFNYKGDPPRTPKTIGPLAQDVEKAAPGSTAKINGILAVPRETLAAATPSIAHLPQHSAKRPRVVGALAPVQGFAAGTPFVQPSVAPFLPPSSPGVAKGIGALSAFSPLTRLPRGATVGRMPTHRYASGVAQVPDSGFSDTVPAMLTPGEAVLTGPAADHLGRHNIARLNATAMPRAGARGIRGALANTKLRPKIVGALSG